MNKNDFDYLVGILEKNAGWHFTEDDFFVIDKKITNFVREKGYASVEELIDELRLEQRPFINQLVESMAMLETSFFRTHAVFKQLEESILPYLREYNRGVKRLRIWSAGCSTGQETYSLAIAIRRSLLNVRDWDIDIIGTDLSSMAINKAQKGIYNKFEIQMGMNASSIISNFHPEKDNWQINDDLMEWYSFVNITCLTNLSAKISLTLSFAGTFCICSSRTVRLKFCENYLSIRLLAGCFISANMKSCRESKNFIPKFPDLTVFIRPRTKQTASRLFSPKSRRLF